MYSTLPQFLCSHEYRSCCARREVYPVVHHQASLRLEIKCDVRLLHPGFGCFGWGCSLPHTVCTHV